MNRELKLTKRLSNIFGPNNYWGPNSEYICRTGLARHADIPLGKNTIYIVATKKASDANGNLFDIREKGTLVGVGGLDWDFQRWLRVAHKDGYRQIRIEY